MNGRTNDEFRRQKHTVQYVLSMSASIVLLSRLLRGFGDRIELIKGNECTVSTVALYVVLNVQ